MNDASREIPATAAPKRRTRTFTAATMPAGLSRAHVATVWAELVALAGSVLFVDWQRWLTVLDRGTLWSDDQRRAAGCCCSPMLDVGNMLAHLRWADRFGARRKNDASGAYYHRLREAALDRFAWDERELALREAVCTFRVCTNTVRHPKPDWQTKTIAGLNLVNETLP